MILLYPGCVYKYKQKGILKSYEDILKSIHVDYIKIDELKCCGIPLRNAGYSDDFKEIAKFNAELMNKYEVSEIIVLCPECHRMIASKYKKYGFLPSEVKVNFIVNYLLENLPENSRTTVNVTYQDSCYLGRRSGYYDEPRELINKFGYSIIEAENTREESLCCGGGGNVREQNYELSEAVAKSRVDEFMKTGAEFIVTNCPHCYVCLSNKGMPVRDISELYHPS
jgi:heterodisulfide reductase subunit D